jgi:GTP cyclohydrolase II
MIKRQAEVGLPTEWGDFKMIAYAINDKDLMPHLAMVKEGYDKKEAILVRIHSECMTGDVFHSRRCDCQEQLHYAMTEISEKGGIVIYLRQEGRGIGLIQKIRAYQLQDKGLDTIQANLSLGLPEDNRNYDLAIQILKDLGIQKVKLLTNNPLKVKAIEQAGIEVAQRIPINIQATQENETYLKTKKDKMGHYL